MADRILRKCVCSFEFEFNGPVNSHSVMLSLRRDIKGSHLHNRVMTDKLVG